VTRERRDYLCHDPYFHQVILSHFLFWILHLIDVKISS
jgi:hypothetical protein